MRRIWLGLLVAGVLGQGAMAAERDRYLVQLKPGAEAAVLAQSKGMGGELALSLPEQHALALWLPAAAATALAHNPNVLWVEPDAKRYASAETLPYGIPMVQAPQLSDAAAGEVLVCIIDSGYSGGHPDLPHGAQVQGSNDAGTGSWSSDENGHGTHVAGTIAAVGGNDQGVVGVLPNQSVPLQIVKVFGANGWAYSSNLVGALNACKQGMSNRGFTHMVINMSLGGSVPSKTEEQAFNQAYGQNVLSVAAAGNAGNTSKSYPASYGSVVSVAAIDANKQLAYFSQRNDQVELAAPGVSVLSTVPTGYAYYSGTSMATPHVVGVAALVWSQRLECSNDQLRQTLRSSAQDLGALGRDNSYGYGLVQAKAAADRMALGCGPGTGGSGKPGGRK
ncbi:S8 family peptidase [Aeromonas hydrophila]|uniref:Extracellular alkaline serine protease n=1 Tax=Aeromonas hydrophila subsp. hydrophila (strain ATCC 7966 / DSM 30187 / BCRC 13018 / CCUG 14551 / JCM 1027 / KCTC 2358 / NCIMB 9240 / NCTC 8049) TaxID=380703 RepID=A0KNV1_AERHH|nr:S8 family peptidase [Aeromonas hydrophila]ABK39419.1 extracellular alkaline serine protease [Aeromonas hydrophila subsp. hydrophila ATCC 7966]MBS4671627.1 S8 family peptidase [Aeromonas hydrophila]OOD30362.1 peptidase S8 [Aeromonas hydrophila]SUU31830.1 extracellular alkaline serine protease [Aeromonas hydrophila]